MMEMRRNKILEQFPMSICAKKYINLSLARGQLDSRVVRSNMNGN